MCTVSFVFANGKTIITSNRDEQVARPALPPQTHYLNNRQIMYPQDTQSGGTWYAVDLQGTVLVLLNGAAEKHHHNPPYRRSRGLIVLDIISSGSCLSTWHSIDLAQVEPFTLVLFEDQKLYQLRWNQTEKETVALNPRQHHIWSSSTLYPEAIRKQRAAWFATFLENQPELDGESMLHFHRHTQPSDAQNGLVINRENVLRTLSITQSVIEGNKVVLSHCDLQQEKQFTNSFSIL